MEKEKLPVVDEYHQVGRREVLRQWLPPAVAGIALAGLGFGFSNRPGRHQPPSVESLPLPRDWRVDPAAAGLLATSCGGGPVANLRQALAALDGMKAFVNGTARPSKPPIPTPS